MSKISILLTGCLVSLTLLNGCADGRNFNNQEMGTVVGGVAGGLLGNTIGGGSGRTAATIAGAAVGAVVGSSVGTRMDRVDSMNLNNALETQTDNRASTWVNPNTNTKYRVTPTATSNDGSKYCRDYQMHSTINGKSEFVTGRACRINGRWVQQ
jgi:uncharacterized protein YcfJ